MINNIVAELFHFNIYAYYLSPNCGTLVVFIAQTVYTLHHSNYIVSCSINVMVDDFDKFDLFFFFYFEIDNLSRRILFFFHPQENSYLLSYPRFSLIIFVLLVFKLSNSCWC